MTPNNYCRSTWLAFQVDNQWRVKHIESQIEPFSKSTAVHRHSPLRKRIWSNTPTVEPLDKFSFLFSIRTLLVVLMTHAGARVCFAAVISATIVVLSFAFNHYAQGAVRTWTDVSDNRTVEAALIDFDDQHITLVNHENKLLHVPIAHLSEVDRKEVAQRLQDRENAEAEFSQGVTALNAGQIDLAKSKFQVASDADAFSIKADFTLGILAIGYERDVSASQRYFEQCIKRWKAKMSHLNDVEKANLAAVHNNLGLIAIRQRQVNKALRHWGEAISLQDETPQQIIQNLGTLSAIANSQLRRLSPADVPLRRAEAKALQTTRASMKLSPNIQPYQPNVGWLYMTYLNDHANPNPPKIAGKGAVVVNVGVPDAHVALRDVASSSGFIVADGYVITNRHVVLLREKGPPYSGFHVHLGPRYDVSHKASLVAYSNDYDLALLKVDGLPKTRFVALHDGVEELGKRVYAMGLSRGEEFGVALTVTRGFIARRPVEGVNCEDRHKPFETALWHDAITNPGNSGGPLLRDDGMAVGVNFATLQPNAKAIDDIVLVRNYSLAVSSAVVTRFIQQVVPDLDLSRGERVKTIDEARDSVAYIKVLADSVLAGFRTPDVIAEFNAFEDRLCMACTGLGFVPCPDRRCKNGNVNGIVVNRHDVRVKGQKFPVHVFRNVVRGCAMCNGNKRVLCEYCKHGDDLRFIRNPQ